MLILYVSYYYNVFGETVIHLAKYVVPYSEFVLCEISPKSTAVRIEHTPGAAIVAVATGEQLEVRCLAHLSCG